MTIKWSTSNMNYAEFTGPSDDDDSLEEKFQTFRLSTTDSPRKLSDRQPAKSVPSFSALSAEETSALFTPAPTYLASPRANRMFDILGNYNQAVFLFADIKDFTKLSQTMPSVEVVQRLNEIYGKFQSIIELHGAPIGIHIVKIAGDCIMLCGSSGLAKETKELTQNQVNAMVYIGYLLSQFMFVYNRQLGNEKFDFRFGIHLGKATQTRGRIKDSEGTVREQLDWFGEAVNKASRMESSSHPNQVQVTDEVFDIARKSFEFTTGSVRDIKSYGEVSTRFLYKPTEEFLKAQVLNQEQRISEGSSSTELPRKKISSPRNSSANH
jgi:class 3 adenylate cyclase